MTIGSASTASATAERLIHRREPTALGWLRELVAIDSEAPGEAAAQRVVAEIAASAGLRADLLDTDPTGELRQDPRFIETGMNFAGRPNCIVTMPGNTAAPVVCNAHVDTVAVGEGWIRRPYGELDGHRFYGRGSCDAKASLVAALLAAAVLVELDAPAAPIEIHSVIDEEPGGNGTLALLRQLDTSRPPRLAITMEPTKLDLLTGHRGMLWYRIACSGIQAHGSMPGGVNAIERAADVVSALRAVNHHFESWPSGQYDRPRLNVGTISGGHEVYTTPASCLLDVSARYAPGEADRVDEAIRAAVQAAAPAGAAFVFQRDFDAAETPADDPAVRAALTVLRGHRPEASVARLAGTCDMRHYRNLLGAPSVIFGPGDLATAHGPDEFVDLPDMFLAARVLVDLALTMGRTGAQ